jgi:hypothetical protein
MLAEKQDLEILAELKKPFPEEILEKKDGPKKQINGVWVRLKFFYIPAEHLHERLDEVFGLKWSWELKETKIVDVTKEKKEKQYANGERVGTTSKIVEEKQVITFGRLYAHLPSGRVVTRDACGGCDITYGTTVGDAFKIADSNAFRKACIKLGIGRYLILEGKAEVADQGSYSKGNSNPNNTQVPINNKQNNKQNNSKSNDNPYLK